MDLQSYHFAWLAKHPDRSAAWLRERLRDGFHVHHIDGDHSNDCPSNLVLIEGGDHLDLHGLDLRKLAKRRAATGGRRPRNPEIGKVAYEYRQRGHAWRELGGGGAMTAAKKHAKENGLEWPIRATAS